MAELVEKMSLLALVSEPAKQKLKNTLREHLDDALYCTRDWSAWSVGTMSEDDFESIAYDDEFINKLAEEILLSLLNIAPAAGTDKAF